MSSGWRIEGPSPSGSSKPTAPLVSLRFLLDALQRRWRTVVALGLAGMVLGVAYLAMVPPLAVGTTTIFLAHETGADPAVAMATDVSLLRTRVVAETVTKQLALEMTPEQFQQSVVPLPVTSQILTLEVSAPGATEAQQRAEVLTTAFLQFRTAQLESQTAALVGELEDRQDQLNGEVKVLTSRYDQLVAGGPESQSEAAAVLTSRSQLTSEIGQIQQQIQDASLKTHAIVNASNVIDPASVMPQSGLKRAVLVVGSGLIAGLALGVALVLFPAITSDKLRRRDEVAEAVGAPVRVSVGSVAGRWRPWPVRGKARERDLAVVTHALESAVPTDETPGRLIVACVDNVDHGQLVVGALGARLGVLGTRTLLADLGEEGGLAPALTRALDGGVHPDAAPVVLRPDGVPHLATGPYGVPVGTVGLVADDDPRRALWDQTEVAITLAPLEPAFGVDALGTWATRAVLLVTAGRSSAERLRSAADLLRSGGVTVEFVVMVHSDRTDKSLGLPEPREDGGAGESRRAVP